MQTKVVAKSTQLSAMEEANGRWVLVTVVAQLAALRKLYLVVRVTASGGEENNPESNTQSTSESSLSVETCETVENRIEISSALGQISG